MKSKGEKAVNAVFGFGPRFGLKRNTLLIDLVQSGNSTNKRSDWPWMPNGRLPVVFCLPRLIKSNTMYSPDVFLLLTACDKTHKASSAFNLRQ